MLIIVIVRALAWTSLITWLGNLTASISGKERTRFLSYIEVLTKPKEFR